jgi:hypothetical protein
MKVVATSDIYRGPKLKDIVTPEDHWPHENHIPKGARFEIGTGETVRDLNPAEQELVGHLYHAGRIISPNNKDGVALIDQEVAIDRKAKLADAELARKAEGGAAIALLEKLLLKLINQTPTPKAAAAGADK